MCKNKINEVAKKVNIINLKNKTKTITNKRNNLSNVESGRDPAIEAALPCYTAKKQ